MKKELLKKVLEGLGSLFKDRGKYFDPASQNFGEVSTLLKGAPKNPLATDKQLFEAQVKQSMMADPKYTGYRKSVLGESTEDDVLEELQRLIGKDPQVINPNSARGKKMMREMQFFPKQKEGIVGTEAVKNESDRILKTMQDIEAQSKNMLTESTFLLDEQKLKNEAVDMFMREIDDGFEPTAALDRMIKKIKLSRTKQADGGRVGMMAGGISSKVLKSLLDPKLKQDIKELLLMRPKANMGMDPAKTADMQQAKNVIRDPRTDLERILKDRADGTKATPLDTMTIRELEQMVQDSPRYNNEQKAVFFKLIDKEKIRADHFYNTGEELPDDMLEMLFKQGEGDFNQGGRVGMDAGGHISEEEYKAMMKKAAEQNREDMALAGFKAFQEHMERPIQVNPPPQGFYGNINEDMSSYNIGKEIADDLYLNMGMFDPDQGDPYYSLRIAKQFNQGGRVGMFAGGSLIGKGIMEAAKLANRGVKPFGAKQTYKQNVKMTGMDELQKGMKKEFDVELYKIDKGRGGNPEAELFDLYEDIVSGKRYSMLPQATRSKMITKIEESMKNYEVDGGDYQNFRSYLFDEYKFPNETAFVDDIRRGIDKGQIKVTKAEDLLDALDRASGENVIPFKPKTKKANGGTVPPLKGPASDGMGSLFRRK